VPVSRLAKWKTSLQMAAIAFLLAGDAGPEFIAAPLIGEVGLWIAAAITLYTGYDYLRGGLRYLSAARSAAPPEATASGKGGSDADLRVGGLEQ
jgi:cardiolipin synthase